MGCLSGESGHEVPTGFDGSAHLVVWGASVTADPSWRRTRGHRQNFQIIGTQKTAMTKNHSMQTMPSFQ
jgi:hypothetical protein